MRWAYLQPVQEIADRCKMGTDGFRKLHLADPFLNDTEVSANLDGS